MWKLAKADALQLLMAPVRSLADLLYPPCCAVCLVRVDRRDYLCATCAGKAERLKAPFCRHCSEAFDGDITEEFACWNCAHRTLHFEAAVSAFRSRGVVRQVIHDFKYNHQEYLRHPVADWLAEALYDPRLRGRRFDALVPVPLHPARERERGFNQAALIAALLSARTGIPLLPALQRVRYTTTQTALERAQRIENLRNAFRLRKTASVRELRVLLIDDILTTGSTLSECARVLKAAGALSVHAATAARA